MDKQVEMYSAFAPPFRSPTVCESGLRAVLLGSGATHVYVVGLATDYCVKATAMDSAEYGFETMVIEEGTKAVDESSLSKVKKEMEKVGVKFVSINGDEVDKVKALND